MKLLTRFFTLTLLLLSCNLFAQQSKLIIDGIVRDEETGEPLVNSQVELLEGGTVIRTFYTTYNGKFLFEVVPQKELVLRCGKENYVAKMISVSTRGVEEKKDEEMIYNFRTIVRLFREMPDLDVSILSQPIGSIFYSTSQKDFDYTVNRDLKRKIEKLQEEVERKIKEKQRKEKEEKEQAAKEEKKKKKEEKKEVVVEKESPKPEPVVLAQAAPEKNDAPSRPEMHVPVMVMKDPYHGPEITDVNQTFEEGYNYTILSTSCVYDADFIELKKISFNWGGRYYKRNSYDITDLAYYKLMEYIQPEGNGYDIEAPKRLR